jgi:hypothetical protein
MAYSWQQTTKGAIRSKAAKPLLADATDKLLHSYWLAPSSRGVVLQYEFRCRLYKRTLKFNLFQN